MKKYLILTSGLLLCLVIHAQKAAFGLKAGVNFSNIWIENNNSSEYKTGIHAGGLAHIHLSPKWAMQPELLFSTAGGKRTTANVETKTTLSYINFPVLVQYMFSNGFRLQGGPQLGFLVDAQSETGSAETDVQNSYKSIDVSFPIGFGYLTSSSIGFDARWVPGLSDINESGLATGNNVFQLGLFYQFGHKGQKHKN